MPELTSNVGVNATTQLVNQIQVIATVDKAQTDALADHENRLAFLENKADTFTSGGSTKAKVAGGVAGLAVGVAALHQSTETGLLAKLGSKIAGFVTSAGSEAEKVGTFRTVLKSTGDKIAKAALRIPNLGAAAAVATLGAATYFGVKIAGAITGNDE